MVSLCLVKNLQKFWAVLICFKIKERSNDKLSWSFSKLSALIQVNSTFIICKLEWKECILLSVEIL